MKSKVSTAMGGGGTIIQIREFRGKGRESFHFERRHTMGVRDWADKKRVGGGVELG